MHIGSWPVMQMFWQGHQHSSQHKTSKLLLNIYNDKHIYTDTQGFMDLKDQSQSLQEGSSDLEKSMESPDWLPGMTESCSRFPTTWHNCSENWTCNSTKKYVLWESALRWDGQDAQKAGGWRKLYKQHQKIYPQLSLITKKVSTSVISGK